MPGNTCTYRIVPLTLADCAGKHRDDILRIWKANLCITDPERFTWFYLENPLGPAQTWLALAESGEEVVGLSSLYPRRLQLGGEEVNSASAIDISVAREHRVFGPAVALVKQGTASYRNHGYDFIFAAPPRVALGVFRLAGYTLLGEQKNWVKVITARRLIARCLKPRLLAAFLGFPADVWLRALDYIRRPPWLWTGLAGEKIKTCDDRFDALWAEVRSEPAIRGVKNTAYLTWRYLQCRTMEHTFYALFDPGRKRLRGFLVYTILANKTAIVTDLLAAEDRWHVPLLLSFCRQMRREDVSHVSLGYFGNPAFIRTLRRLGFMERNVVRHCMLFTDRQCSSPWRDRLLDPNNWSLFEGDLDL